MMENGFIKELLLECTNEKVRIGIAELIGRVLKTLSPYEYDFWTEYEVVDKPVPEKENSNSNNNSSNSSSSNNSSAITSNSSSTAGGPSGVKMEQVKQPRSIVCRFMDAVFAVLEDSRYYDHPIIIPIQRDSIKHDSNRICKSFSFFLSFPEIIGAVSNNTSW